jgi:hypothetical protein
MAYPAQKKSRSLNLQILNKMKNENTALEELSGARLTSVQFVMDYLILGFDGKGALTTLAWPKIIEGDIKMEYGMSGYRDSLCELITKTAKKVSVSDDEVFSFIFENSKQLQINLRDSKSKGERAILTGPDHLLCVW